MASQELVKIVIPSYHRADRCKALAIPNSVVCVPESEAKAYADNYGADRVVAHPDSVLGIVAKRLWIMEKYPNVFMMDDEYDHLVRLYLPPGSDQSVHLTPEETYDVIQSTAYLAREMGVHLFGFSTIPNPTYYSPFKPFRLVAGKSYMVFWGIGILEGHKIFIPKDMSVGDDTFMNLANAYYHRIHLQDLRYIVPRNQDDKAGLNSKYYRREDHTKANEILRKYFAKNYKVVEKRDGTYTFDIKIDL
jgi:hypothetical protein|nr:MAG TPA: hypothetical protein [Caudoviricetes sp.]